tara:strand:+ start:558 stop:668 length:111 start_codon:yes stop_codon:yes gene_type:complete
MINEDKEYEQWEDQNNRMDEQEEVTMLEYLYVKEGC